MPQDRDPRGQEPAWLTWARELHSLSQAGLTYTKDQFDIERYRAVRRVAARMMASGSGMAFDSVLGLFEQDSGYATPKVDVRGAVIRGDNILLVREASDGRWCLPGGWADVNETPRQCVAREVKEESGFDVTVTKLAAVFDRSLQDGAPPAPHSIYKLFFLCDIVGGEATPSQETTEVAFFSARKLPELSRGRTVESQIARMFAHHRDPSLPTDFD